MCYFTSVVTPFLTKSQRTELPLIKMFILQTQLNEISLRWVQPPSFSPLVDLF